MKELGKNHRRKNGNVDEREQLRKPDTNLSKTNQDKT